MIKSNQTVVCSATVSNAGALFFAELIQTEKQYVKRLKIMQKVSLDLSSHDLAALT